MARLAARLSCEFGLCPAGLLAAPPAVFEAIAEISEQRARERELEELRSRLGGMK